MTRVKYIYATITTLLKEKINLVHKTNYLKVNENKPSMSI